MPVDRAHFKPRKYLWTPRTKAIPIDRRTAKPETAEQGVRRGIGILSKYVRNNTCLEIKI